MLEKPFYLKDDLEVSAYGQLAPLLEASDSTNASAPGPCGRQEAHREEARNKMGLRKACS